MDNQKILQQFIDSFQDNAIRSRSYYPEFRRRWEAVIRRAAESDEVYFDTLRTPFLPLSTALRG